MTATHLTFDELAAKWITDKTVDIVPCVCWSAGRGRIKGVTRSQVQHPAEFDDGAQDAFEEAYDC